MRIGIFHAGMSVGILGILGMPVGLNHKFTIKQLIEGACYIVMYRDVQCNEKLIQQAGYTNAYQNLSCRDVHRHPQHACLPQ
jgi:xanthosine utilization system XapX-like protein